MTILFLAIFNSILGLSVLFPVLGPLGRQLGLTELQVGSLSTSYALMQLLMGPVWGRRSERVGRKPVLLTGVLGFCGGFLLFGVVVELGLRHALGPTPLYLLLLGSRALGGAFSSATLPTAQAYVADVTSRDQRTSGMAVVGAAFGLGVIFGPGIGAALSQVSLLAPVYFSAAVAALNAVMIAWKLVEPERHSRPETHPPLGPLVARLWPLLAIGGSATLASVAMEQTIAFYFQDRLALSAQGAARAVGLALVGYGVVAVFAQGFLVRRYKWSPSRLVESGLVCAAAGFCGLILARAFPALALALSLQGFGQGLVVPGVTAALSLAARDDEQGAVAGLGSSAQAFGRLLGPVVGTALYQLRPEYPYVFSAVLVALAAVAGRASGRVRSALSAS